MYNAKTAICVNFCSNLESNNEIYSLAQYEASKLKVEESDSKSDQSDVSDSCSNNNKSENDNNNSININSADDDKNKLKECTEKSKLEQELPHQQPEKIENQQILNKTCKVELHSIKVANSPPAPKLPIPITDNDLNEDRSNNSNNNTNKLCTTIKREQSPTIVAKSNTTSDTPPLGNPSKSIDGNKTIVCEHPLSPLRRNLQSNCLIGNDNNVNNKNNNNITNNPSNKNLLIPKLVEEIRPKSVTASVFRPATLADLSATQPTPSSPPLPPATTSTSAVFVNASNAALPPLNAAPRAQSVTASVFTSISQLCNKQQQYIAKTNSITTPTTVTAAILSVQQQHHHQQPQTQTRTQQQQQQDMNKFLTFGDDATELTMLKEEPDDLAHLAPAAVDACMRLDDAAPFCGEMLLGLCSYSYGGFLPDDYSSLDSTTNSSSPDSPNHSGSNTNGNINNSSNNQHNNRNNKSNFSSPAHQQNCNSNLNAVTLRNNNNNNSISNTNRVDPFINYREESNDTNSSQHLLSPCVASKSPEASSLPSLCSPNSLSQDDGFAFMTMSVDEDIDMTMRAPYIPMNEQEDLPLLTADDLMWCASNGLGSEELNNQKDVDATLQQLQLQQQHSCESNHNLLSGYQDAQHITQSHLNSLCSSPASTVSSLSPSPVSQQQQQQQQDTNCVYNTDTSELAALLCGSGSGTLSILNNNCSGGGGGGNEQTGAGLQQQQEQAHQQQSHCGDFRLHQLQQDLVAEQQDQQQRQMQLLGLSIDCKKESSLSPSLCDSIEDAFEHVYSKDSTNLDCWNELLQINVNESSSSASPSPAVSLNSPQQQRQEQTLTDCKPHLQLEQQLSPQQQQQQHQQHNIILNAVPLITIQNTKNILLQQQLQHNARNKMIINDEMLPANRGGNKITTIKLVNGQSTPTATAAAMPTVGTSLAASNGTTIRLIDGKLQQLLQQKQQQEETPLPISAKGVLAQQQSQQQQSSHKRHLLSTLAGIQQETKRMKSTAAGMELHAVPQLLQQLVTPVQPQQLKEQEQKQQTRKVNGGVARWPTVADAKAANGIQQQPQSNSVLKNLLISGCDVSAGYCLVPVRPKKLAKA